MSIEFTKIKIEINGKNFNGLVKREADIEINQKVKCNSYCRVKIDDVNYIVLWKFTKCQDESGIVTITTQEAEETSNPMLDLEESSDSHKDIRHSLPFKVLGTCHSTCRQDALEEAYSYLHEYNRPVFAKLEHEPDNPFDNNAIAVFVQTNAEYKKVGYIASELTKYVLPHLHESEFDVSVKHIRFCTNFWRVGYYITLELSRQGLWNKEVIKASKHVK